MPDAESLPTGTVTFLFTDVEGSTRLWEQHPDQMRVALAEHEALVERRTAQHEGHVVRPRGEGDSRFCVFARATDAVAASGVVPSAGVGAAAGGGAAAGSAAGAGAGAAGASAAPSAS